MKNSLLILIFILCTNSVLASEPVFTTQEEYFKNNPITYAGDPNWLPLGLLTTMEIIK